MDGLNKQQSQQHIESNKGKLGAGPVPDPAVLVLDPAVFVLDPVVLAKFWNFQKVGIRLGSLISIEKVCVYSEYARIFIVL